MKRELAQWTSQNIATMTFSTVSTPPGGTIGNVREKGGGGGEGGKGGRREELEEGSLMGQTFAEKEHMITVDRFPWYGGIQKQDIMAVIMRKEKLRCLYSQFMTSVISKK